MDRTPQEQKLELLRLQFSKINKLKTPIQSPISEGKLRTPTATRADDAFMQHLHTIQRPSDVKNKLAGGDARHETERSVGRRGDRGAI
ncbi:unnamed protein product [Phytophthora fragariaefolia]|uniref:Unnamed protein product n=1 Tax=Phytophthora fragariaefolia TaxID=1490495 RepID=A0A9W6XIR5_9STRA|nr:unnamed protein product [Phytophthora fragariaefolia]